MPKDKLKYYHFYKMDVTKTEDVQQICAQIISKYKRIDALINAVGGNISDATTSSATTFFDLPLSSIGEVYDLNLLYGVILPSQVFGKHIVQNADGGSIINISSMNAIRPLTRIPGYSAAKAGVSNFTQWLATDLALKHGDKLRVNAIAPGFFLTKNNEYLLFNEDKTFTNRANLILKNTPMARFGNVDEILGTVIWLLSEASKFVTGAIIPIDGGFSCFSGV
jgi:NAD(P)-dependent dehydrogenase (short-subunit alcohol dehydrogenase family)